MGPLSILYWSGVEQMNFSGLFSARSFSQEKSGVRLFSGNEENYDNTSWISRLRRREKKNFVINNTWKGCENTLFCGLCLPSYLPHDGGVGKVVLQEGEGLPLPDVEPVGEHDVEAEWKSSLQYDTTSFF